MKSRGRSTDDDLLGQVRRQMRIGHIKHVIGRKADGLREIDLFLGDWRS